MNLSTGTHPFFAVAVVSLLSFASFRLHARRAAEAPPKRAMSRIRRALGVGLPLTGFVAVFALLAADALGLTDAAIRAASPALAGSPVGGILTWVPTFAGVAIAIVAGYLGAFPYIRAIREVDVSASDAAMRLGRVLAVFFGLFVVAASALVSLPASVFASALPMVGFVAAIAALTLAAQPTVLTVSRTTRELTDDERGRLDRLSERAGLSARATTVIEVGGDRTATATLAGLPGRRHLFVTDHLLGAFDDDAVSGVLAGKTGRARRWYREYKFAVVVVGFGLFVGRSTGDLGALTRLGGFGFVALLLGAMLALAWFGKRLIFAADDYAVERVGAETYVETLETVADEHQVSDELGRLRSLVLMRPSLGDRLDRLRSRTDE